MGWMGVDGWMEWMGWMGVDGVNGVDSPFDLLMIKSQQSIVRLINS